MSRPETRIKVVKKYRDGELINTEYHPQEKWKFLCFHGWQDLAGGNARLALKFLYHKTCDNKFERVWHNKEWVESLIDWYLKEKYSEYTEEEDYYKYPDEEVE